MDQYAQAINQIIKQQQAIIGPSLAVSQAKKVVGLEVTVSGQVSIKGNGRDVLGKLVDQYAKLFGRASVEVCREAVKETKPPLSQDELPEILK